MTVLQTGDLNLPPNVASGIIKTAQDGSAVARLSGAEPFKFGETEFVTLNDVPKAEFVGESQEKSSDTASFGTFTAKPRKAQTTLRFSQEVLWADEDYQLGVLNELGQAAGVATARALDLGVLHAMNPLTGLTLSGSPDHVAGTANTVTASSNREIDIEDAVDLLIDGNALPTGLALTPRAAADLRKLRDSDNRRLYPELPLNPRELGSFSGLTVAVGDTVDAAREADTATGVLGIVGDWASGVRWGIAKTMPVHLIQYGDPDGEGDLQRKNEIALRVEVAYVWYVDESKFAVIKSQDSGDDGDSGDNGDSGND